MVKRNLLLVMLLVVLIPNVQSQSCLPVEYRISYYRIKITTSIIIDADVQYYNPNSEKVLVRLPFEIVIGVFVLFNASFKNSRYSISGTQSIISASPVQVYYPGVYTTSTSTEIRIKDSQQNDSQILFLPDGIYQFYSAYFRVFPGYPLILNVTEGKITEDIAMPSSWDYEKYAPAPRTTDFFTGSPQVCVSSSSEFFLTSPESFLTSPESFLTSSRPLVVLPATIAFSLTLMALIVVLKRYKTKKRL